jgi:hypothetical protein
MDPERNLGAVGPGLQAGSGQSQGNNSQKKAHEAQSARKTTYCQAEASPNQD